VTISDLEGEAEVAPAHEQQLEKRAGNNRLGMNQLATPSSQMKACMKMKGQQRRGGRR
jgi:hypothetical protein